MNIIAITYGNYPDNEASVNRHLGYLRGLSELGNKVILISLFPFKKDLKEIQEYHGVKIIYCTKKFSDQKSKLSLILIYFISLYNCFKLIFESKNEDNKPYIINLLISIRFLIPILIFTKVLKLKTIHERTEYPFINNNENIIRKAVLLIYLHCIIPNIDGLFVITEFLKIYFSRYTKKPIIVICIVVEADRLNRIRSNIENNCITYIGNMYGDKDGVPILVEAFAKISKLYPQIRLLLIGDNSNIHEMKSINNVISKLNIKEKVVFAGKVNRDQIFNNIGNSKILCLARPNNIQAEGGFPTKLGEYLITGIPVLITKVGEIPKYLSHDMNAFLAEPGSSDDFAEKMLYILDNYEHAQKVGKRGKELALKLFDYRVQSEILLNFIREIAYD